jgi:hypothetical protein
MSESPTASAADLRAQFLARRIPTGDCTPVPADDCPIPGVHVARMSAGMYLRYAEAVGPFEVKPGDSPDEKSRKAERRLAVRLRYAACDAEGTPVFRPSDDDLADIDFDAVAGLLAQFSEVNGMVEKKAPPPSTSPGVSPSSAGAPTSPAS